MTQNVAAPEAPKSMKAEVRATWTLAWPMILAQIGAMAMIAVDMMMVGRLGAGPLAAVAFGNSLSFMVVMLGVPALGPINPMVSRAMGAKDSKEVGELFRSGLWTALLLSLPITLVLLNARPLFGALGNLSLGSLLGTPTDPAIVEESSRYARMLGFGIPFSLLYAACQNSLRGLKRVKVPLYIMLLANVVNLAGNWVLIYGNLGAPAMGSEGCALATAIARVFTFVVVLLYIQRDKELRAMLDLSRLARVSWARVKKLLSLGLPVGLQSVLDYAIYAVLAILMSRLGAVELAAHQITHNLAFLGLVASTGVGQAGMIRISRASGEDRPWDARRGLMSAYLSAAIFIVPVALALFALPALFVSFYTPDPQVGALGVQLLRLGALFMLVNAFSSVALFALMGVLDTRVPAIIHITLLWGLTLPLGYVLAFHFGHGAAGLWVAICIADALLMLALISRSLFKLPRAAPVPAPAAG